MLGKCPHCGSTRIRRRYRRHRYNNWRCRRCNRVFARPKTENPVQRPTQSPAQAYPQPAPAPKYASATAGANATSGAAAGASARPRPRKRKVLPIAALVILIAAIGLFALAQVDITTTPRQQPIVAEARNVDQPLASTTDAVTSRDTANASIPPTPNAQAAADANTRATPETASVQSAPAATPTSTYTPEPTPTPPPTSMPEPAVAQTPTPTPPFHISNQLPSVIYTKDALTPTPVPPPHLRHLAKKEYMLTLINAERRKAGRSDVELGNNNAAQLHAEAALINCFGGHWGVDGLKPYMRYSLAGGYQSNGENSHGLDYCIKARDNFAPITNIAREIKVAMDGWTGSSGHNSNILNSLHRKVNIGLAWDRYNFVAFQHFEGDYVVYDDLPTIDEQGSLSLNGRVKNGARISNKSLSIQIYYDQPPHTLTSGQVARTYCYDLGLRVASLREPLTGGRTRPTDEYEYTHDPCPSPYDVSAKAPAARTYDAAHLIWLRAFRDSLKTKPQTVTVSLITADEWQVANDTFVVAADLSDVLQKHGDGVYTIIIDGRIGAISQYSIFVGVTPPDTYSP